LFSKFTLREKTKITAASTPNKLYLNNPIMPSEEKLFENTAIKIEKYPNIFIINRYNPVSFLAFSFIINMRHPKNNKSKYVVGRV
jgi:hypothetical protein